MSLATSSVPVGLIGFGAIGQPVGAALAAGNVPGCHLSGVLTQAPVDAPARVDDLATLLADSEIVVEAAGQVALADYGPCVVAHGTDLLLVSVGALVDPELREALAQGPGRTEVSSGAVGGFDALRAAALHGGLEEVRLTTSKPPGALREPWMSEQLQGRLAVGRERIEIFEGTAAEAVERFPRSVNVAATLALATLGFDRTHVRIVADPHLEVNEHLIEAAGEVGEYALRFRNHPSPDNPRTSGLTSRAVLRRLGERAARLVVGA